MIYIHKIFDYCSIFQLPPSTEPNYYYSEVFQLKDIFYWVKQTVIVFLLQDSFDMQCRWEVDF